MIRLLNILSISIALAAPTLAHSAEVGAPAPGFTATDSNGKIQTLAQYQGKHVVLEWLNYDCPFVKKHYGAKNMQSLQKTYTGKGVVWLSVISSGKGQQGNFPAAKVNQMSAERGASPSAILLDSKGEIGRSYGAKTTPHMFVIDPQGKLVYAGAIDDKPTSDAEDIAGAKNYVAAALDESMAGKPVTVASTKSYGCGVHY